ncbi:MAG: ROK family transcriptional regulator [Devosiaceae bacterium]|nr:ROK family transcriptional regulator [Devosiaceae bacterium]
MTKSGHLEDTRKSSRGIVLASIRELARVARIDIAEHTGISQASVTGISAELLEAGLIEEVARQDKNGDQKRGRPRVDLKIRGAARLVAGVKLGDKNATVAILDFEGNMVGEFMHELPKAKMSSDEVIEFLHHVLNEAAKDNAITLNDLSGVGFGLAGVIDVPRGFVHWSPSLTERNLPLRELLETHLGLPVFLDNDVNLVALAEQWFGLGKGVSDFIVITIENGVGMGIVINGEIYRGTRGCGAEFGHTKVQLDGALCRCGQRGCLEAYVADYALLREANYTQDSQTLINPEQQVQSLFMQAKGGDQTAQLIFKRAGKMFAMGLANVVNIFDPALIILSGERMQFDYLYAGEVIENMKNSVVQIDVSPPRVLIHKWGDLMWAKGAAVYAMEGVTRIALGELAKNAR